MYNKIGKVLKVIGNILKKVFFTTLVLVYFLFEDLIWNSLALPFIKYINQFNLYKNSLKFIGEQNEYVILFLFCSMFGFAEYLGFLSFMFLAQTYVFMFCLFYSLKTLFAIYSLAILNNCKEKLFYFRWFKFSYEITMKIIDYIKNTKYYLFVKENLKDIKSKVKDFVLNYKENFRNLITKLRELYSSIKNFVKNYNK